MPLNKEKNRRIYITALVISFLLIVGSIYLHLKQKTHLGRMSFNLDRERVKPTGGVEAITRLNNYNSSFFNQTSETSNSETDIEEENNSIETASPLTDDILNRFDISGQTVSPNYINEQSLERNSEESDVNQTITMNHSDEIIDDFADDINQNPEYDMRTLGQDTNACLRCLCMTVNECRPTFCGSGNPCGLYRISKMYWMDGGKPTIAGGTTDNEDQDYLTCVNEDTCATTVIRQYYERYKRDCNKDGVFDCRDQIALHLLGPTGCLTNNLSYIHANRMRNCLVESNLNYLSYSSEEEY